MSSFVARVVTRKKVYLSRSRWPEPGTIANEQIRPTHGAVRIRIPDRWTNCRPWAAMGSNEVFCPLGVWKTVILRQRDQGCRAMANASRVGSPDGVNCPNFHNLNLRKSLEEIGQRGLTQLQLRARGGHNHNFEGSPERLTGKVRNRVSDTVKTVWRCNHNRYQWGDGLAHVAETPLVRHLGEPAPTFLQWRVRRRRRLILSLTEYSRDNRA